MPPRRRAVRRASVARSSAARDAFGRLLGRCAVILRSGCAVAFAVGVTVGRPSWIGAAVAVVLAGWAAVTSVPALRRAGSRGWSPGTC